MRYYYLLIIFFPVALFGQDINSDIKADLIFYGDVMTNADLPENRVRASEVFSQLVEEYLAQDDSQIPDLSFVRQLSKIVPEDSLFTIYTWQVELDNKNYDYFGYISYDNQSYQKLTTNTSFDENMRYMTHSPVDWYGALYYNIVKFAEGEYLLFGYNATGEYNNAKVVDVLSYDGDNIVLGKEIFQDPQDTLTFNNKIYISYSEDASVNLNYNPGLQKIVHDHLIQRIGRMPGQGPTYLPDGTYEGYYYDNGKWMYKKKLFDHSYGENNAPRPKPVLNTKRKIKEKSRK
ncbi:hypothetical protein N9L92_00295 [Saprospiraceae bacterium]|nr:hypothetical protein [Saprospiraceae bacterium]